MNNVILSGRLTKDAEVRNTTDGLAIARYTIAVDRRIKKEGEQNADFISCVAFGKNAEFIEKYVKKGTKLIVSGRIQTGSYTNRDGNKVYTTDVIIETQEFAESKKATDDTPATTDKDGFMNVPADIDEDLPFGKPVR